MASTQIFEVEFQIRKAGSGAGAADTYRKQLRRALVSAASAHPKDILAPLTANITLGSGESFDVVSVKQAHIGSEGANVLS